MVRARYDAAATTSENRRHWAAADTLSAAAANSPSVRRTLRARARYEVANNSYARGIVSTLANYCIGPGPRLQMLTEDEAANRLVEREFTTWAEAVGLPEKLRTMRQAAAQDGEAFALLTANERLESPVKLDLRLIEADQVTTPQPPLNTTQATDGIVFDRAGNPVEYHVLKNHPGDGGTAEFDRVPAEAMIHYFRVDRPGQVRGIPEITPALPLFAQLRRYTLAVIAAAETAADFAAVLYTDAPPDGDSEDVPEAMDLVELERRMATVLPGGWKLGQIQSQQPSTRYGEFKREILNEIARCLEMPYNVAACNSSGYNYASGRLDHQVWHRAIRVQQGHLSRAVLDRLLRAWLDEAILVTDYLPLWMRTTSPRALVHQFFWDGMEHVDPLKEAGAQAVRLGQHTTTLAYEYARQGRDWEVELRQRGKEQALMRQLGLAAEGTALPEAEDDDESLDEAEKNKESSDA